MLSPIRARFWMLGHQKRPRLQQQNPASLRGTKSINLLRRVRAVHPCAQHYGIEGCTARPHCLIPERKDVSPDRVDRERRLLNIDAVRRFGETSRLPGMAGLRFSAWSRWSYAEGSCFRTVDAQRIISAALQVLHTRRVGEGVSRNMKRTSGLVGAAVVIGLILGTLAPVVASAKDCALKLVTSIDLIVAEGGTVIVPVELNGKKAGLTATEGIASFITPSSADAWSLPRQKAPATSCSARSRSRRWLSTRR